MGEHIKPIMNTREAADYLGIGVQTLVNKRSIGGGPTYHKCGRLVRYYKTDLDAWMAEGRQDRTPRPM